MRTLFRFSLGLLLVGASAMAQSDTQPPQLLALSVSPGTVDVTSGPRTVTFTLHVTDDLSGIDFNSSFRLIVSLRSPSGNQSASAAVRTRAGVILNANDIAIDVVIDQFSEPGFWTISNLRLRDNVDNQTNLDATALASMGFPSGVTVIDANPDTQAPQLTGISLTPNAVDVSAVPATVAVQLSITDDASGFSTGTNSLTDFEVRSPSGTQSRYIYTSSWRLVSGTATNGVWASSFEMPRYSEPGVWKVVSVRLRDRLRTTRLYSATQLASFGSATDLAVSSTPADLASPQLKALSFSSAFINTSVAPQNVQVDMGISDNLAGVSFALDVPSGGVSNFYGVTFRSPSGAQTVTTNSTVLGGVPPNAGGPLDGSWRFDAAFPQFSEEGTWTATATIKDATRNVDSYTPQELGSLGLPAQIVIIRPSLVPDAAIGPSGGLVADNTFGQRARLHIPSGAFSTPTNVAIDVLQSPLGIPLPQGFSSAESYFVNVELTPTPSYPLPLPGITVVLPLRNYVIPGTQINLLRVDQAAGLLVPALNFAGAPVVGQVANGGLTAVFSGVARFSTIVGALPTAIPVIVDIRPGEAINTINLRTKGTVPVAILSTPTLDLTHIAPSSLRLSGVPVARTREGNWQVSFDDVNDDGRLDLIAHFQSGAWLLSPGDTHAVVEGLTLDNRLFRGIDAVNVIRP